MLNIKKIFAILFLLSTFNLNAYQTVVTVGPEEILGSGRLPNITIDNSNSPCVSADGGASCYIYTRDNNKWNGTIINVANYFSKQYYNTYIEADNNNNLWVSGIMFPLVDQVTSNGYVAYDTGGIGLIYRDRIKGINYFSRQHYHPRSWECGNASFDRYTQQSVIWINEGSYGIHQYAAEVPGMHVLVEKGSMSCGRAGEGARIGISKAGPFLHSNNKIHSVWHLATVLHAGYGMSNYQNSDRDSKKLPPVAWADPSYYNHMGEDGCYVSVTGDGVIQTMAYMACDLSDGGAGGVYANVFNGREMVAPINNILQIHPTGSSGSRRFEPLIAPAKFGGAYIIFSSGNRVYIRFISPYGILGQLENICNGSKGAITTDINGNLHIAYIDGQLKYRKLSMSTATDVSMKFNYGKTGSNALSYQAVYDAPKALWYIKDIKDKVIANGLKWGGANSIAVSGDFDGDGFGDVGVWDKISCKWYIYSIKLNKSLLWDKNFGMIGSKPVSGDYNGDGKSDIAIYHQPTGKWYIMGLDGTVITWNLGWGYNRAIAVPGDYDGDKKFDLAVCDEDSGNWFIYSIAKNKNLAWNKNLGISNAIPVSGDFDGNGKYDLAMFDRMQAKWYIQNIGGKKVTWGTQWGFKGGIPCAGDFDADGKDDIGIYDGLGIIAYGNWYVYSLAKKAALVYNKAWGYKGTTVSGSATSN